MDRLPEKWAVRAPKEFPNLISDYFNKNIGKEYYKTGTFFHFPSWYSIGVFVEGYHTSAEIRKEYTEISFEDFKRLILNQEINYPIW